MKVLYSFALCALLFTSPLFAADDHDADTEALRGLSILKQLVTQDNYKNYGLKSMEEVNQLELGRGIDVFYVFNDDLKEFQPTTDLSKVIKSSQTRIYPVAVRGEGRLLITVRQRDGKWRTAKFGRPDLALALAKQAAIEKAMNLETSNTYELEIPAMHLNFVATGKPNATQSIVLLPLDHFTMMAVNPGLKNVPVYARVSGIKSAKEVFETLAESAKSTPELGPPSNHQ